MIPVLVIMGPTASGKSGLALELAARLGRAIVVADSRQVYRGLRIGTAQPSAAERARIPHHLVDFLPLDKRWSAHAFAESALAILRDAAAAPPLVVGGTGFYLRSLMEGLFPLTVPQEEILAWRRELNALDTAALGARLREADPETAARLAAGDRQRILRALEVQAATGMPLSAHHRAERERPADIAWRPVRLVMAREKLHARIERRLDAMLAAGWRDEVAALLETGADPAWPGLQSLGYPEIVAWIRGGLGAGEARERILVRTRQYAKRQETWFRAEAGATLLDPEEAGTLDRLRALVEA